MIKLFKLFVKDESGTTVIEYTLIGSIVSIGIVSAVSAIGETTFNDLYNKITAQF